MRSISVFLCDHTAELRELTRYSHRVLSGMSRERVAEVCISLGASEFVEKREPVERVRFAVRAAAGEEAAPEVGW